MPHTEKFLQQPKEGSSWSQHHPILYYDLPSVGTEGSELETVLQDRKADILTEQLLNLGKRNNIPNLCLPCCQSYLHENFNFKSHLEDYSGKQYFPRHENLGKHTEFHKMAILLYMMTLDKKNTTYVF